MTGSAVIPDKLQSWKDGIAPYLRAHWCPGAAWLAGYPRSGAALVRTVLSHCFGHRTGSVYTEQGLPEAYQEALKTVHGNESLDVFRPIAREQGFLFVKTHEQITAPEALPAIVIVRDARRVFASLRAFFVDRMDIHLTPEQIIAGQTPWGDWTNWINSWQRYGPRNALWLRYEDILAEPITAIRRIALHFGLTPVAYELPEFSEMHAKEPTIFRVATVEGNGDLTESQEDMFWTLHGGTMNSLGYYRE